MMYELLLLLRERERERFIMSGTNTTLKFGTTIAQCSNSSLSIKSKQIAKYSSSVLKLTSIHSIQQNNSKSTTSLNPKSTSSSIESSLKFKLKINNTNQAKILSLQIPGSLSHAVVRNGDLFPHGDDDTKAGKMREWVRDRGRWEIEWENLREKSPRELAKIHRNDRNFSQVGTGGFLVSICIWILDFPTVLTETERS